MESSIFVSASFKGVFWHFKVDRRILLTLTVYSPAEAGLKFRMNNVFVNQHILVQLSIISELENAGNEESVHSLSLNYTEFKMQCV